MGALLRKPILPIEEPGIILRSTGIQEFDKQFQKVEETLGVIKKSKEKLEEAESDFISLLGAEGHFTAFRSHKMLIKMMLVVLSVQCRGKFEAIQLTYEDKSPFIDCSLQELKKPN